MRHLLMRHLWIVALVALAAPLGAQQMPRGRPRAEELRQQVMERWLETYRDQAALTPEQDRRFRDVFRRSLDRRRELQEREQQLWRALEGQMRPGVAASPDSVTQLLEAILAQRAALVEQARSEQREYAQFLSPVQRAQLFLMWERFQRQIEQVMRQRMGMPGFPGPPLPRRDTLP